MKKKLVIGTIGFVVIAAMFTNTEEEAPETTDAETVEVSDNSKTETDKEKSESQKQNEEEKAEKEKAEKEKAEKEKAEKEKFEKEKAEKEKAEKEKAEKEKAEKEKAEKEKAEKEKAEKEKAEEEAKAEEEKAKAEAAEKENNEEVYLQIMRENLSGYVDIQFQKAEKNFKLTPTDAGLIDEISMLPLGVGHEDWAVLVDGMKEMSKGGKELVGEGYSISLVNPLNHENIILWIMDGEVIYNVIDDL